MRGRRCAPTLQPGIRRGCSPRRPTVGYPGRHLSRASGSLKRARRRQMRRPHRPEPLRKYGRLGHAAGERDDWFRQFPEDPADQAWQHFRGQPTVTQHFQAPAAGTETESWDAMLAALGLKGMKVGQRFTAPAGAPALSGVVEYATRDPFDAWCCGSTSQSPGVAALGIAGIAGWPIPPQRMSSQYLHGDKGSEIPHPRDSVSGKRGSGSISRRRRVEREPSEPFWRAAKAAARTTKALTLGVCSRRRAALRGAEPSL